MYREGRDGRGGVERVGGFYLKGDKLGRNDAVKRVRNVIYPVSREKGASAQSDEGDRRNNVCHTSTDHKISGSLSR